VHAAEAGTTLRAACGGIADTVCSGTCIDPQLDPAHCGGCDVACVVKEPLMGQPSNGGCVGGSCQPWWGACFEPAAGLTCASQCAAEGARCAAQGCFGWTLMRHDFEGSCEKGLYGAVEASECDVDLGGSMGMVATRCCCE
jgi:hypothetical protein